MSQNPRTQFKDKYENQEHKWNGKMERENGRRNLGKGW